MPRCPNGTRRNKKTGECEKHTGNKKTSASAKRPSPQPVKSRQKRCPNGTRRNKKSGECEKKLPARLANIKMPTEPRAMSPKLNARHLSNAEIDELMEINMDDYDDDDYDKEDIRRRLKNLTFDPKYVSCFGEKHKDLFSQANAKLECWNKYSDEF